MPDVVLAYDNHRVSFMGRKSLELNLTKRFSKNGCIVS